MALILLVDDERNIREFLSHMLQAHGHEVVTAGSGAEGLEAAGRLERPPDLLITDVRMPGVDGRELWRRLHEAAPATKCLFISGYPESPLTGEPVLAKPFTGKVLAAKVDGILNGKKKIETAAAGA